MEQTDKDAAKRVAHTETRKMVEMADSKREANTQETVTRTVTNERKTSSGNEPNYGSIDTVILIAESIREWLARFSCCSET